MMEDFVSNQDLIKIASKNINIMEKYEKDQGWVPNGEVKTDKVCKIFKLNIQSRLASKGVVEDVDGTPEEIVQLIYDEEFIFKLDPDLKEYKELRKFPNDTHLSYMRYKGMGPVSDRDFLLIQQIQWSNNKKKFIVATKSITLPYDLPKGVVRGECLMGGYIVQQVAENKCRVIYLSDADIKGMIPDMIKRVLSQNQGSVAGRINECLKQWRQKKLKNKS